MLLRTLASVPAIKACVMQIYTSPLVYVFIYYLQSSGRTFTENRARCPIGVFLSVHKQKFVGDKQDVSVLLPDSRAFVFFAGSQILQAEIQFCRRWLPTIQQ